MNGETVKPQNLLKFLAFSCQSNFRKHKLLFMKDTVVAAPKRQMFVELMEAETRISNLFPPHCHAMAATSTSCLSCVQSKHSFAGEVCAYMADE
jgi:hypothetical protein